MRRRFDDLVRRRPEVGLIVGNMSWLLLERIARMFLMLAMGVWTARYLGKTQYGQLNYARAMATMFTVVATMGLDTIIVRELVRDGSRRDTILGTALAIRFVGGLLAIALAAATIFIVRPDDQLLQWMTIVMAVGLLFRSLNIGEYWFQSQMLARKNATAKTAAALANCALRAALILGGSALVAFAWVNAAEFAIEAAVLTFLLVQAGVSFRNFRFDWKAAKTMLHDGWPLIVTGFAIFVYMRIDQIMLGEMVDDDAVGIYAAAVRLSEAWYMLPTLLLNASMKAVTQAKSISAELYENRMRKLLTLLAGLAYAVAIPLTLLSTPLVTLLFTSEYAAAGPVLRLHIWAAVFVFLGVGQSAWIINEGLTRIVLINAILGAAVNVVLNYLLIPHYGAIGCAIATVISYAVSAWLANALFPATRRMFRLQVSALTLGLWK